jgi:hypothetical protein
VSETGGKMKKENKKRLCLNKRTIQNLVIHQDNFLAKHEQGVIKAGSDYPPAGTTNHPKYCLP